MSVRVLPYAKEHNYFHSEIVCTRLPRAGEYLQILGGQKQIGYRVEKVVLLHENMLSWDALVEVSGGSGIEAEPYMDHFKQVLSYKQHELNRLKGWKEAYHNPSGHWQRRKDVYERIEAGETREALATEMGVKPARIQTLYREWKNVIWWVKYQQRNEEYEEKEKALREKLKKIDWHNYG